MVIFFEIIKFVFFAMSIVVWFLLLQGDAYMSSQVMAVIKQITIPGYLVLSGLMIGYIITQLTMPAYVVDERHEAKIHLKGFLIGLIMGFILAMIYVFF